MDVARTASEVPAASSATVASGQPSRKSVATSSAASSSHTAVIGGGDVDVVGLARPLTVAPSLPADLLAG